MAKIVCNHCKSKFIYKSNVSKNFDKIQIYSQYNIRKIEGKYYCQPCMRIIGEQMSKETIIEEARKHGMKMPSEVSTAPTINIERKKIEAEE